MVTGKGLIQTQKRPAGTTRPGGQITRIVLGVGFFVVAIIVAIAVVGDLADHPQTSAIQAIQIYAAGLFWLVLALGVVVAGYVLTRGLD